MVTVTTFAKGVPRYSLTTLAMISVTKTFAVAILAPIVALTRQTGAVASNAIKAVAILTQTLSIAVLSPIVALTNRACSVAIHAIKAVAILTRAWLVAGGTKVAI